MSFVLVFDMDGTIFKSESILLTAFKQTFFELSKQNLYKGPTPSEQQCLSTLGKLIPEIWDDLLPTESKKTKDIASFILGAYSDKLLSEGRGQLYPGVKNTLINLKKSGWQLYITSNGTQNYIKSIVDHTGIAYLFSGLYTSFEKKIPNKEHLVKILLSENQFDIHKTVMVGDRIHDVQAAKANDLRIIGCTFGYGVPSELSNSDCLINSFPELPLKLKYLNLIP